MNYRYLLSEMLIDYCERRFNEKNMIRIDCYTEIINDLRIALDIEPGMMNLLNEAKKIINGQ